MSYTTVDYLADQLKAAAPGAEWDAAGHDRARELALILQRAGVRDLSKLLLLKATQTYRKAAWDVKAEVNDALALSYEGRTLGFMGTPDRQDNDPVLQGAKVAWSAVGHGNVSYVVQPAPGGFAIVPQWGSSSDTAGIRAGLLFIGSIVVSFALPQAGIAAANSIGSAVLGPTLAAQYPALATAIGNVAISTAMNGGDIAAAVKNVVINTATGGIGAAVGGAITSATDLALLGKLADTVTRTFISGGDIEKALAVALVQNSELVVDSFAPAQGEKMSWFTEPAGADDFGVSDWTEVLPAAADFVPLAPMEVPQWTPIEWTPMQEVTPLDQFGDVLAPVTFPVLPSAAEQQEFENFGPIAPLPIYPDLPPVQQVQQVQVRDLGPALPPEPPMPAASDPLSWSDAREIVGALSSAALAALKLQSSFQAARQPAANTTARRVDPVTGQVQTVLDTGVVQSRDSAGRVINTRPRVGEPQMTVSGNVVLNNGDGTYTLISSSGATRRIAYGDDTGSDSPFADLNWPLLLGAGGLLLSLVK